MRGEEVPEMQEEEGLDVDIILVVISAENMPIPQSFVDQIYKEANMKKKRNHVLLKKQICLFANMLCSNLTNTNYFLF